MGIGFCARLSTLSETASSFLTSEAISWQTGTTPREWPINMEIMAARGNAEESRYFTDTAKLK